MIGSGTAGANGVKECVALAEYLTAPVVNSYLHNDSFPANHALACGPLGYQGSKAAMKLISRADVVLALGSRLGPFGTLPQHGLDYWPQDAKIIQIDTDAKMLGLVKPPKVELTESAVLRGHQVSRVLHELHEEFRGWVSARRGERRAAVSESRGHPDCEGRDLCGGVQPR